MKASFSISKGKGSIKHNTREFSASNVDKSRTQDNVILKNVDVKQAYQRLFDVALEKYNAKQKRNDRKIKNYYEHIAHSRQEKPFYELIIQIGDKDNSSYLNEKSVEILKEFVEKCQDRYSNVEFFGAYIHLDESTPHLHLDYIPFAAKQKRGLETRNSHNLAMKQMGFDKYEDFREDLIKLLTGVAKTHNIERQVMNNSNEHIDIHKYKQIAQEVEKKAIRNITNQIEKKTTKAVDYSRLNNTFRGNVKPENYINLYNSYDSIVNQNIALREAIENRDEIIASNSKTALKSKINELREENSILKEQIQVKNEEIEELKDTNDALENKIDRFERCFMYLGKFIQATLKKPLEWIFERFNAIQEVERDTYDLTSRYFDIEDDNFVKYYHNVMNNEIDRLAKQELRDTNEIDRGLNKQEIDIEDDFDLDR